MEYEIVHDDAMEVLTRMTDNSVDAIVTDPPYGLSFMGKKWDYDVPSVMIWKECLRVLKPGGHLLSFAGSRTYHRMAVNIEDAGFEIRDQIMWLYGSGFPKSHNLSDDWEGWGTQLKPAHEPIVMARKPFKGTVAKNVLEHGTGALNIDTSRIDYNGEKPNVGGRGAHGRGEGYGFKPMDEVKRTNRKPREDGFWGKGGYKNEGNDIATANPNGRWPANIIHDGIEDEWARYFYCPKASKAERGEGNNHPTVKPVALMEYLIRLVTPPNGVVLDPFLGSGTTGVAAIKQGFHFIGIEREADYIPIAEARMTHANDETIEPEELEAEWV
jgi:site-specific DNA-methyltransferase (adenine-specific)